MAIFELNQNETKILKGGPTSNPLLQVIIPIHEISFCGIKNTDNITQICAGDANKDAPKDSCSVNTKLNLKHF